jgi:hypothetical protein
MFGSCKTGKGRKIILNKKTRYLNIYLQNVFKILNAMIFELELFVLPDLIETIGSV